MFKASPEELGLFFITVEACVVTLFTQQHLPQVVIHLTAQETHKGGQVQLLATKQQKPTHLKSP